MLARMPAVSQAISAAVGASGIDRLVRARRYRLAGRVALALWMAAWVAFAIVVATDGSSDLVSALAVLICLLFAISFVLEARARRLEVLELVALAARDDLSASRSRGLPRVR
jgi:hypothetical protein